MQVVEIIEHCEFGTKLAYHQKCIQDHTKLYDLSYMVSTTVLYYIVVPFCHVKGITSILDGSMTTDPTPQDAVTVDAI